MREWSCWPGGTGAPWALPKEGGARPSSTSPQPLHWKNVAGRRSRQLLRHAKHTGAVHGFMASLVSQAGELGWEVVQLDPPIRASRYFRHWGRMRSIHPDAFGLLRRDGADWPFFLEWERRAVRPAAMRARLAPYLRYYSTSRPIDDHGAPPRILVVFNLEAAATGFLRVARKEMEDTGTFSPLLVSHRELVARKGPAGAGLVPAGEVGAGRSPPSIIHNQPIIGEKHNETLLREPGRRTQIPRTLRHRRGRRGVERPHSAHSGMAAATPGSPRHSQRTAPSPLRAVEREL